MEPGAEVVIPSVVSDHFADSIDLGGADAQNYQVARRYILAELPDETNRSLSRTQCQTPTRIAGV